MHHFIVSFAELYNDGDFEGEHSYLYSLLDIFKIPKKRRKKTPTIYLYDILYSNRYKCQQKNSYGNYKSIEIINI